jgi:hypothetical protein
MYKSFELSESQTYDVDLFHRELGPLGRGRLSFGAEKMPQVTFRMTSPANSLSENQKLELVQAKTENGRCFSLFECEYLSHTLLSSYLIDGDVPTSEFRHIHARYDEISAWFFQWQRIDGKVGEKLEWSEELVPLVACIQEGREQFSVKSEYYGTLSGSGEDRTLHQHIQFAFERTNGLFKLRDLKSKTLLLSSLLSILIGHPVSLVSLDIGTPQGRRHAAYFPTAKRAEADMQQASVLRYLLAKNNIEERWQTIFERYYRSSFRKLSWMRLAGMKRFSGFWEHKALAYVSLLDRYVTQLAESVNGSLRIEAYTAKLIKFNEKIRELSSPLTAAQIDEVSAIAETIFEQERGLTFVEKYEIALKHTDSDISKIINLSDEDFRLVKRMRDKIAHGDDVEIQQNDFQKVNTIVARLALLLTYWAFLDIGLTNDDFTMCLRRTHHRLRFDAELDQVHLARVTQTAAFFAVSEAKLQSLIAKPVPKVSACFVQGENGELEFSEKYTNAYRDWQADRTREPGVFSHSSIFGVPEGVVRTISEAYIEATNDRLALLQVFVFDEAALSAAHKGESVT